LELIGDGTALETLVEDSGQDSRAPSDKNLKLACGEIVQKHPIPFQAQTSVWIEQEMTCGGTGFEKPAAIRRAGKHLG
jgi:hypothetical protein